MRTTAAMRKVTLLAPLLLLQTFIASLAFAGSAAGHSASISDLTFPAINFFLYVFLMWKLLSPPIRSFAGKRADDLDEAVNMSERLQQKAQQRLTEAQGQLAAVEGEIQALQERIAQESRLEAENLIDASQRRAQSIAENAKASASAEERSLLESLRREIAEKAIAKASQTLQGELTVESDQALRQSAASGAKAFQKAL